VLWFRSLLLCVCVCVCCTHTHIFDLRITSLIPKGVPYRFGLKLTHRISTIFSSIFKIFTEIPNRIFVITKIEWYSLFTVLSWLVQIAKMMHYLILSTLINNTYFIVIIKMPLLLLIIIFFLVSTNSSSTSTSTASTASTTNTSTRSLPHTSEDIDFFFLHHIHRRKE